MISKFISNVVALRLLRIQTVKMDFYPSAGAVLLLKKPISASHVQPSPLPRNYMVFPKANFGTCSQIPTCNYEEVKALPNHPEKYLIDVREPSELKETGQIPRSINIPLGSVKNELSSKVTSEAFQRKYGREKPLKHSEIIFHCRIGKRSANAAEIATKLGYTKVKNYEGSWLDWAEREGLPK